MIVFWVKAYTYGLKRSDITHCVRPPDDEYNESISEWLSYRLFNQNIRNSRYAQSVGTAELSTTRVMRTRVLDDKKKGLNVAVLLWRLAEIENRLRVARFLPGLAD